MTDAEIAGLMGWRGPGAYTATAMRKVKAIIAAAEAAEREACAKAANEFLTKGRSPLGRSVADAIRTRA